MDRTALETATVAVEGRTVAYHLARYVVPMELIDLIAILEADAFDFGSDSKRLLFILA